MPYWIVALQIFNSACDPSAQTANSCHMLFRDTHFATLKDCQNNGESVALKQLVKRDVAVWWCVKRDDSPRAEPQIAHDYQKDEE